MSDQQIEEEVELQVNRDRRAGRSILVCSVIGLFGPCFSLLSSPLSHFVERYLYWFLWPIAMASIFGLFAANVLLDPARKNILESKIRRRESQSR